MGMFGSLYLGVSGLQSSQESLNVVAHNVTNTDTKGYTRQQVSYGTREYNKLDSNTAGVAQKQTGLGVFITEVRQVRDRFVDASYRNQAGRQEVVCCFLLEYMSGTGSFQADRPPDRID